MSADLKLSVETLQVKTKAARLRALMPLIEAKVRDGVRHTDIIVALNEQGFELSKPTYLSILQRYRQKQSVSGAAPASSPHVSKDDVRTTPSSFNESPPRVAGNRPPTFEHDPKGNPDLLK